jgi:hypothetical protein
MRVRAEGTDRKAGLEVDDDVDVVAGPLTGFQASGAWDICCWPVKAHTS